MQNRWPDARDIRIYRHRNRGCFPRFEARQIGKSASDLCVTTVGLGRFFAHAWILNLTACRGVPTMSPVSSSVGWCRSMASRDPRTQELNNLKVALATFALQLDIFEARIRNGPLKAVTRPDRPRPPDLNFAVKTGPAMKSHSRD